MTPKYNQKKHPQPPLWADSFITWRLSEQTSEEVIGDLHELFGKWVEKYGTRHAQMRYIFHALGFLRPLPRRLQRGKSRYRNNHSTPFIPTHMLFNNFKIAYRNLLRNWSYAAINITGLSVGIASCLLIFLVIEFETSFDTFHTKRDRIYRVVTEFNNPDAKDYSPGAPLPIAEALRIDFPQLHGVAAIFSSGDRLVSIQDKNSNILTKKFKEPEGVFFAEPQFFNLFDFPWLAGDPSTALNEPNTAVLTRSTADRYLGNWKTAIGKNIQLDNKDLIRITGILDDVPANTDFPLKIVVSYETLKKNNAYGMSDWISTSNNANCYVLLPSNLSMTTFNNLLSDFVKKHKPAEYVKDNLILQPLGTIHFDNRFGNFNQRTFSRELITALTLIGIFLLVIACVNFINLSTAQAINRAKEVGVRKVLGSGRWQLIAQFIGETALITLFAVAIAYGITVLVLPSLSSLLKVPLPFPFSGEILLFLIAILLIVTFISGLYPATVLSGFNPIGALKSKVVSKMAGGISLRRSLVVVQFCIAQILVICTLVVMRQTAYFQSTSMGFDKQAIITFPLINDSAHLAKYDYLRNQLEQIPGIKALSFSYASPADKANWFSDLRFDHSTKSTQFGANLKWADTNYFKLYNLHLVAGRLYFQSDTIREFVVNETLVKELGFNDPQKIIGKELNFWNGIVVGPVVGVVKDFHTTSLRAPIPPVVMGHAKDTYQAMNIKIESQKASEILAQVEDIWTATFPEYVYEFHFLDERIGDFYKQETQLSLLYKIFAAIAIFISCLGLYGLVSFMAVQRNKEVGIRKVLGASVRSIVYLFSKEFTVLIAIAFLIAAPVAYYFMHHWLANFTFRIPLSWTLFALAGLSSVVIAWLAVGYKAVKAAITNPVNSIRTQ